VITEGDISPLNACSDLAQPSADMSSLSWAATTVDNSQPATVSLDVHLADDRSGVNWGIMYVRAPGGPENSVELQGARVSGTANDRLWRFTGTVPAGATAGDWHLSQVHISDRSGHHTQYWGADDGSYTTNLSGASGGTLALPPSTVTGDASDDAASVVDLESLQWITEPTVDNAADQTVGVTVHVTDAGTGLCNVIASIRPADRSGYLVMYDKQLVSGTEQDGVWKLTTTLPAGATTGANNINMGLIGPGGATLQLYPLSVVSGTATDGVWNLQGALPKHAAAGAWRVNHINVSDRNGHESNNQFNGSGDLPYLTVVETAAGG
jgi:hypothetical protein